MLQAPLQRKESAQRQQQKQPVRREHAKEEGGGAGRRELYYKRLSVYLSGTENHHNVHWIFQWVQGAVLWPQLLKAVVQPPWEESHHLPGLFPPSLPVMLHHCPGTPLPRCWHYRVLPQPFYFPSGMFPVRHTVFRFFSP